MSKSEINSLLTSLNARSTLAKLVDESSPGTTSVIRHVSKNSQVNLIQELQDASSEPEERDGQHFFSPDKQFLTYFPHFQVNNTQALPYDEESIRKVSL